MKQSIFFTIIISFVISILFVSGTFLALVINSSKSHEFHLQKRYFPIARMILDEFSHKKGEFSNKRNAKRDITKLKASINSLNMQLITNTGKQNAISYNPKTKVVVEKRIRRTLLRVLQLNDTNYIYIKKRDKTYLVKDKESENSNHKFFLILAFLAILLTLLFSFIFTLKKLYPLKLLKDKVKTLGDENFDFECYNSSSKDEVSLLALEFKKTAEKLKDIKEARNIFIRNIMHELKTPITKGKFLSELDNNKENDQKMRNVFNRLESLINEFSSIEELISSTKNVDQNDYFLSDIIDNATDMLLLDEDVVNNDCDNFKLHINYKLFCVAVKNLIDNALKYSSDNKVSILTNKNKDIIFQNRGDKLKYKLENYFEPFFSNDAQNSNSFGLGLYIVNSILKANDFILEYKYEDGINSFIITKKV